MYDKGFRLPYYGNPKNDWLRIELDHSHRLTSSKLLPEEWQIALGMQMLPTLSRIFGVVNVDTSKERYLDIAITRERLQKSKVLKNLQDMVRFGLDWYAIEEKKRKSDIDKRQKSVVTKVQKIEDVLIEFKPKIQREVFNQLEKKIKKTAEEIDQFLA